MVPGMKVSFFLGFFAALVLSSATSLMQTTNVQANSAQQLVGLWKAKRRFGSDVGGSLTIRQTGGEWSAEIAGQVAIVKLTSAVRRARLIQALDVPCIEPG
jgi:hypothetical protein